MASPEGKKARTKDFIWNNSTSKGSSSESSTTPQKLKLPHPLHNKLGDQLPALQSRYSHSTPFQHCKIASPFLQEGVLENVLGEIIQNVKADFKESDLFRVYQSIDLGNLPPVSLDEKPGQKSTAPKCESTIVSDEMLSLASKMPALMSLKSALLSSEFRAFIEKSCSLPPGCLMDKVDCAANCHDSGCHLLCHDDVIGTRKVSFILYLTDPDWADTEGGSLELYESVEEENSSNLEKNKECGGKVPGPTPVKTLHPSFNSFIFFVVNPGESFHSVQQVFGNRPRLSLQGWYHTDNIPDHSENATLQRLKSFAKRENTEVKDLQFKEKVGSYDIDTINGSKDVLSESDRLLLSSFINETYLQEDAIKTIRAQFEEDSSVQLRHFIKDSMAAKISNRATHHDKEDNIGNGKPSLDYNVGVDDHWSIVGPAHKQRFLEYVDNDVSSDSCGALLKNIHLNLFQSAAFARYMQLLTSLGEATSHRGRVRRFRPGLDYTVAHYGILTKTPVLDATLCFVAGKGDQCLHDEETGDLLGSDEDALWTSGDVGGFECYIEADDDSEEADAEYDADDDTELLSVSPSYNTLSLVYRDPGTMRFVKYVSSFAPSSRWDLSVVYDVTDDSVSD
eukprot:CAMPEP_0194266094 /NCGR_PEP_ID=MMETSP0169-20130528/1119_1 /TAXON_ID=218684 /ORGANISM="Corethron pennatum, Strain L29A3" /LENGTH=621 /DNA_ID=CAMNT_0039006703 /DNA_START=28 /DNA_END=1893 /DNA_ORIENTATION=+